MEVVAGLPFTVIQAKAEADAVGAARGNLTIVEGFHAAVDLEAAESFSGSVPSCAVDYLVVRYFVNAR